MNTEFWHDCWQQNDIAFHKSEANPLLLKYLDKLALPQGARIFVPLCGKTLDIPWLLAQVYRVAGAELVQTAVEQLFAEMTVEP
ncbi:MAG: thiopurine S-methyltransferase, partial [Myxococcota bacterium]